MAAPLRVEQRLSALEERMTALERLPDRMDRLDARMDGLGVRMDGLDHRMDGLDHRMDGLDYRMDGLDHRMDGLDHRMDRLESELVQLRTEMRDGFAAVRGEIAAGDDRVMTTLSARIEDSRRETRVLHEDVIARFALLGEGLTASNQALVGEMRAMFDAVNSRLTAIENRAPVARRRKSTD